MLHVFHSKDYSGVLLLGRPMTICKKRLVNSLNQSCRYLAWVIPWGTSMMVVNLNLSFTGSVNYPFFLTTTTKALLVFD